jgi:hypothetical protein
MRGRPIFEARPRSFRFTNKILRHGRQQVRDYLWYATYHTVRGSKSARTQSLLLP